MAEEHLNPRLTKLIFEGPYAAGRIPYDQELVDAMLEEAKDKNIFSCRKVFTYKLCNAFDKKKYLTLYLLSKAYAEPKLREYARKRVLKLTPYANEAADIIEVLKHNPDELFVKRIFERLKNINNDDNNNLSCFSSLFDYINEQELEIISQSKYLLEIWKLLAQETGEYNALGLWRKLSAFLKGKKLKERKQFASVQIAVARNIKQQNGEVEKRLLSDVLVNSTAQKIANI